MKAMFGAATNMIVKTASSFSRSLDILDELASTGVIYSKDFKLDALSDVKINGYNRQIREAEAMAKATKRMKELGITMPEAS